MTGLSFQSQKPIIADSPNRMDIACFVGLVDLREGVQRDDINQWLYEQSWLNSAQGFSATYHRSSAEELLDVPVPIESWERFAQLFSWNERVFGEGLIGATYLAAAVRSFFAQGGRKCYVVRVASPPTLLATAEERLQLIEKLVPGYPSIVSSHPSDRNSWHGVGHLLGLPDVTMLSVPDLPDLLRSVPNDITTETPLSDTPIEQFVVCSEPVSPPSPDNLVSTLSAPSSNVEGFRLWAHVIHLLAEFIAEYRRDIQLIAAIPLADKSGSETSPEISNLLGLMHNETWLSGSLDSNQSFASAFVQLSYPWLRTVGSDLLPQRLEPPDGSFIGILARNAITRGAYRSVAGIRQTDIQEIYPKLSQEFISAAYVKAPLNASPKLSLIDRVSLFGSTSDAISILSDVTTSNASAYRPANVNRIISMVLRVARQAGEEYVFENNGERLWADITQRLNAVLRILFDLGALRGKQPEDAYFVRCDKSTMSQQDLDTGRVVAEIQFEPAASIESINVILAMHQNGSVSLESIGLEQAVA